MPGCKQAGVLWRLMRTLTKCTQPQSTTKCILSLKLLSPGRSPERSGWQQAQLMHCKQDAPMHRLQAIAHVRQHAQEVASAQKSAFASYALEKHKFSGRMLDALISRHKCIQSPITQ